MLRRSAARLFDLGLPLLLLLVTPPVVEAVTMFDGRGAARAALALALVVTWVYETLLTAAWGQTLGKRLARLRVEGSHGGRPSVVRSGVRALPVLLAGLPAVWVLTPIAYLWSLGRADGRGVHDLAAGTHVRALPFFVHG